MKNLRRGLWIATAALPLLTVTGCKSYWIDAEVENRTGQTIHELEVDYPTASFGANSIAPGNAIHYRLQIRGSGQVKVEYTFENGKTVHARGLNLQERQSGRLLIELSPGGKVEFVPNLEPAS